MLLLNAEMYIYLSSLSLPHFLHYHVYTVFLPCRERCDSILWYRSEETFRWFCQLLDLSFYQRPLLLGMMLSATSMSELIVLHVTEALQENLARIHYKSLSLIKEVLNTYIDIYENVDEKRLVLPMIEFLDILLTRTCIGELLYNGER